MKSYKEMDQNKESPEDLPLGLHRTTFTLTLDQRYSLGISPEVIKPYKVKIDKYEN